MTLLAQDPRLARRVGTITLLVMAGAIAGFVFLLDRIELGAPVRIRVLFRHGAGLREHAPLVVGGEPVGRIESITPVPHGAAGALGGQVGVAATVAVDGDSAWKVPARAVIFVASRGALSDRYLEVAPPDGDPGPAIRDGAELRGVDPPSLDNVLQHTWANLTTFKLFVEAVRPELAALRAQLDRLRDQLGALAGDRATGGGASAVATEVRALVSAARATHQTSLGGEPGVARLRAVIAEGRQMIALARAAIDVLGPRATALADDLARVRGHVDAGQPIARAAQAIARLRAAADQLDPLLARIDELGARIAAGEGSLGRLMGDPEFPEDAKELGKIMKRQPWKILERPAD